MTNQKITGKFYPLYHEEYLNLRRQLKPNELDLYLYLVSKNPFEDSKIEIDTALISEQLGYHRRTVQLGINKLASLNLLEIEITSFKYRKAKHGCSSYVLHKHSGESVDRQSESVDRQSESVDRQSESVDRQSESVDRQSESVDRDRPSKPSPEKVSSSLQTLQTLQTDPNSLRHPTLPPTEEIEREKGASLKKGEEEQPIAKADEKEETYFEFKARLKLSKEWNKFYKYCEEEIKNLRYRINDLEAYLAAKNTNTNKFHFLAYYENFKNRTGRVVRQSYDSSTSKELTEEEIKQKEEKIACERAKAAEFMARMDAMKNPKED